MVFDYNRSLREENGESPVKLLSLWREGIEQKETVRIGFNRVGRGAGVLGEVRGVHHQKIAVFDNRVIVGGANLSKSYFLNRKDRYMQFD
jgi:phosphatidylserine/phosphatidylglycerophosphate/cardiolipin synthase-like enzyme